MIIKYTIIVFIFQLLFIYLRTWNIQAVANNKKWEVVISNGLIHLTHLINTAIGIASVNKVLTEMDWEYLPIVIGSLFGVIVGSYLSMNKKKGIPISKPLRVRPIKKARKKYIVKKRKWVKY